ncbi:MAG: CmpA/NrtA family ABC transporter substrate-binding protein [Nibricoccus sp.]
MSSVSTNPVSKNSRPLRVGFLALTDAAPFVVAQENGLFARHGIEVDLRREVGWATIREKIIYGELDAAHAPAPMLWATRLGVDSVACPVLTALVLNLHGNALTLSERLWEANIRTPADLRDETRRRNGERKLTFGVVFMFSSHHLMLRAWLRAAGINPDRDVRIVVVPPAQMFRNLAAGTIDGYCSGEPWNSLAVREKTGWCPTWSSTLQPGGMEKVLMVTEKFAFSRPNEHAALVAALTEACAWCDEPANREPLANLLAGRSYINQSARVILPALQGQFDCGHDRIEPAPDFVTFHRNGANVPTQARAAALQAELVEAGLLTAKAADPALPGLLFRENIFRQATQHITHELVSP